MRLYPLIYILGDINKFVKVVVIILGPKTKMELRRIYQVPDGMGGFDDVPGSIRYISGTLITVRGDERLSGDKLTVVADFFFYIDYPIGIDPPISEEDYFIEGTTKYNIVFIADLTAGQKRTLKITLKVAE